MEAMNVGKRDIAITIPRNIRWEDYQRELDAVRDWKSTMYFKVANLPVNTEVGRKCWLCYNDELIGWMIIVGMHEGEFTCDTTGKRWNGKFIARSGPFHRLVHPVPMKGFRGFRYL